MTDSERPVRMDALLPPEMAVRAEETGVKKASKDSVTTFVLAVLDGTGEECVEADQDTALDVVAKTRGHLAPHAPGGARLAVMLAHESESRQ